jgi:crotonobetainyl-CoA:carnitine CoA-transferase CaiB-like acyl-CoA transferase
MLLGDMGATVIKVERPEVGDDTRHWGPPYDPAGRSTYFEAVNRNKTSVAIDMTNAAGLAEARELIKRADIVIHNFPPSNSDKFGLDYESVKNLKPEVIYCSITGFGSGAGALPPPPPPLPRPGPCAGTGEVQTKPRSAVAVIL